MENRYERYYYKPDGHVRHKKAPPPSPEDKEKIIQLYEQKVNLLAIAKQLNTTRPHVLRTLKDAGKWNGRITPLKKESEENPDSKFFNHNRKDWFV